MGGGVGGGGGLGWTGQEYLTITPKANFCILPHLVQFPHTSGTMIKITVTLPRLPCDLFDTIARHPRMNVTFCAFLDAILITNSLSCTKFRLIRLLIPVDCISKRVYGAF